MPLIVDGAGDLQRAAGVHALEDEERAQRDDEARQLGPHDHVAVDEPDRHRRTAARPRSRARCSSRSRVVRRPSSRPELPIITPAERSNSPPIISSATGTATIPYCAAWSVHWLAMPRSVSQSTPARRPGEQKNTATAPTSAPMSGRSASARQQVDAREPLVRLGPAARRPSVEAPSRQGGRRHRRPPRSNV